MKEQSIVIFLSIDISTPTEEEACFYLAGSWEWGQMPGTVKPTKKCITLFWTLQFTFYLSYLTSGL